LARQFSKAQVEEFFQSPVWKEVSERISELINHADSELEIADPYEHGVAVGRRRAYRIVLSFPETLAKEASNKSPYLSRLMKGK
jgi:hypothetical protein